MANSKSNIYPIQLQGAELNLNKYDAEIKQYSGFNKNNAPFIGGCLSNLFTKNETIPGASSRNTYIAPNGDVYRVTTEGLFKNDELLIDTSESEFFDVEEVTSIPDTAIFVYDEDTYIYMKNQRLYYYSNDTEHDFMSPFPGAYINRTYRNFNICRRTISGVTLDLVIFMVKSDSGYPYFYINLYTKNENGEIENVYSFLFDDRSIGVDYTFSSYVGINFVIKTYGDTFSDFKFAILTGENHGGAYNRLDNSLFSFNGESIQFVAPLYTYFSDGTTATTSAKFSGFIFTDKKAQSGKDGLNVYTSNLKVQFDYTVDFINNKIILDIDYVSGNANHYTGLSHDLGTYFQKSWGCAAGVCLKRQSDNRYRCFTVDDEVSSFPYVKDNKVYFYIGCILNDTVLINGGIATGLSLPGGWELVTEWNTIDKDYIFFGENTDEWKENKFVYLWKNINTNKWYKLIKSTPWIKVIDNQVIINSNTINNSYDIKQRKILLFAPAWNNRRIIFVDNNTFESVEKNYYIATSINEYNLKNNSSIIINPVLSVRPFIVSTEDIYNIFEKEYVQINCYHSQNNGVEVTYKQTITYLKNGTITLKNQDLIDLPFPTNTDGNIQYSPSLFAVQKGQYGNLVFISEGGTAYKLMTYDNKAVMSYFISTAIEGLQDFFTIQGQLYGILNNQIYAFSIVNEVANKGDFVVDVEGLQFCGNTPYEALFFSKTNRCLYSFTGSNVLNSKQFVDKISEIRNYKYNPATQSIFLLTDIGVLVYSLFGTYQIDFLNCRDMFLLDNGVILTDNEGTFKNVRYYKEETTDDYIKENLKLETMFYGMNDQTVTINDCLYMRIFSEEHEEGDLEVSATTLSLKGRMTEKTTFKIKAEDWDKETHTIYLRYQPKEQRGLGISFKIESPFKIASLSVGSQADAILVDKVSKGAINTPFTNKSSTIEW